MKIKVAFNTWINLGNDWIKNKLWFIKDVVYSEPHFNDSACYDNSTSSVSLSFLL